MSKSRLHARIGTFRQLEILLAVSESGSIARACEALHLSQPTVSMQLKKLADSVGETLYETRGRKLYFTDAGQRLIAAGREIFDVIGRLDSELADLHGLKAGTLKLAVVTTAKYFIPHLLGPFCARFPEIDVSFAIGNREQVIERLERNDDDIYIFSHPPRELDINVVQFAPNPLVVIASRAHPLAQRKRINFGDIVNEPFLMRESGSGTRLAIETFLAQHHHTLNVRMTISSNEAIKHAVAEGLGLAIVSQHSLAYSSAPDICVLNVKNFPIKNDWYLVSVRGKRMSKIAETFVDYLQHEGVAMLRQKASA